MLSIRTNLSSLIAQNNLLANSNKLNQAIERMTTGSKINHAKDNAANCSIATNIDTKMGALRVAEDNVLSGLDLVMTATEVISMMEDRASRLSALSIQAKNGTNGALSLGALNAEAGAIVSEIMRLYNSTQFNDVNLFNRTSFTLDENLPQAGSSGFIEEPISTFAMRATTTSPPTAKAEYGGFIEDPKTYTDQQVADMKTITQAISESSLVSGVEYSISTKDELVALADYVNAGNDTTGMTFVLGADIDLSSITNWTPIGDYSTNNSYQFKGIFDGNGHTVSNLTINRSKHYQGLFGYVASGAEIKNVGIKEGNVKGSGSIGSLVGYTNSDISNCYSNCSVQGVQNVGGLIGYTVSSIYDSYSTGSVDCTTLIVGGLVGYAGGSSAWIDNCFATGTVTGVTNCAGGLIGNANEYSIINSYAIGNVTGGTYVGGLIGRATGSLFLIDNCFATGQVRGTDSTIGGLAGEARNINNSYATGKVSGIKRVGGLVGTAYTSISNSYATGNVNGETEVGGFIGHSQATVSNSYAKGNVIGLTQVGGLIGNAYSSVNDSYATGDTEGDFSVGGLVGNANSSIENCYSEGSVQGTDSVGGLVGYAKSTLTTCYSTGNVNGEKFVGGLVGQAYKVSGTLTYTQCHAYGKANGIEGVGGLIGGSVLTTNGTSFGTINTVDCQAVSQSADSIGGVYQYDSATTTYILLSTYDKSSMNSGIEKFTIMPTRTTLLLGINGEESSSLSFDTNFVFDFSPMYSSVDSEEFSQSVNLFVKQLQEKTTILGAVQNRLESALDEISIKYENLASSRSTIRDADIAEVSSSYIKQQIIQQAGASLLASTQNIQYQNVMGLLQSLQG